MALDIGEKRIGVSVSDALRMTAQGLTTIEVSSSESAIAKIASIAGEYDADEIVLGLPKNMDGSIGRMAEKVISFKDQLERQINLPIILWDERLTSRYAENLLIDADMSRKKRKKRIDKVAAIIILQGYLDWRMNASRQ